MSWFIRVLILRMSLVVAVPVSQLKASPKNGSKLRFLRLGCCGWFVCRSLTAEVIVDSDDS